MPLLPRHLRPRSGGALFSRPTRRTYPSEEASALPRFLRLLLPKKAAVGHPSLAVPATTVAGAAPRVWRCPRLPHTAMAMFLVLFPFTCAYASGVRVRDIAMVAGARENQLVGYGLVAGLAGQGDKDPVYTKQTIANLLQRYGIHVPAATLSAKNVAVVMVTAEIPAFYKRGERLDVVVASMGDASTLQGGVLLQTPLLGADNRMYAVAQGPVSIGGFTAGTGGAGGATVTKNHPTTATIVGGALVEREIPASIVRENLIELLLREPGFTSASHLAASINSVFTNSAHALDSTTVQVRIPEGVENLPVDFIAQLEGIETTPDTPARIIINERTGTIVATARIQISSCAVAHGNITINIASTLDVSQPNPLSNTGRTVVTPSTSTQVNEAKSALVALPELPTIEKVASALNNLGVTPRDMMAIFQAMKQAGALQAELILR
jgi:flagellar P-ring protein FlgI